MTAGLGPWKEFSADRNNERVQGMSNENQETIADIVKEMRTLGRLDEKSTDKIPRSLQALGLRTYADRIEAAARREREAGAEAAQVCGEIGEMIGREATREKPSQVGNAAKMREAMSRILGIADHLQTRFSISRLASEEISELKQIAESALAAPPRNCDMYTTLDDARNAFFADYVSDDTCSSATAFAIWLYDKSKGEAK